MLRISKCSSYFMAVMTALLVRPDPWARERPLAAVRSFEQIYGEGRTVFYRTLTKVSLKSRLSDYDRSLFALAEEKFPGLYEYFMQFYYYLQRINREKASFRAEFLESSERLAKELVQSVYDVPVPPDQSILPYLLTTAGYGAAEGIPSFRYMLKAMESATKRQWAWQALEMRKTHRLSKGKGINLAIIDSGIDPTIRGIRGKISKTINFLDGSKPLAKKGHFPYDWTGHGTFVTCIAHQVAPESDLFIVKVASPARKNGLSFSRWTAYRFAAGIIWAALNGADVINLSYASTSDISVFQEACKFCWDRNIVLVAAAGNALTEQDKDLYYYPAAYPWTIAVGGVENKGSEFQVWEHSAQGNYLDVLAPSTGVWVQFPSYLGVKIPPQVTWGNSLAAPIVSGAAALILSAMDEEILKKYRAQPGKLVETVRGILDKTASNQRLGFDVPNPVSGYGMIDLLKAVQMAKTLAN